MSEALQLAIFNMIVSVGLDATVSILKGMKNATTIDDVIAALVATQKLTAADFKEKVQE